MATKGRYNVLAVYSLEHKAGREHFAGVLDGMSDKDWRLDTVKPECFFPGKVLANEDGEPYDGVILSMAGSDDAMERIARSSIPAVFVNITDRRLFARRGNFASVWNDNADIGRRAAHHLLEHGEYKSVGFLSCAPPTFYAEERLVAFRQAMKRGGYEVSVINDDKDGRHDGLRRWLNELPKPAGIMAVADMRASQVINICREEGLRVPAQVAVIGADYDVSQHERCGMTISSVVPNMRMMGREAVKELAFLFRHPNWKGRPHEVVIPAKGVFTGESTTRSASAARLVSAARGFIAANSARRISPSDVAAGIGCSRSLAELRFSQIEGVTIRRAIENARLEEAERRIQGGDSVKAVAESMGFTSANQLYRMYKRHFGHTIRAFRKPSRPMSQFPH